MRSTLPLMVVTALLVAACSEPTRPSTSMPPATPAAGKSPAPTYQLVTTTLDDRDAAGNAVSIGSDDYNGSGFATYTETNGATSHVNTGGNGGWQLYLGSQKVRTIHLAIAQSGFPVPAGNYYQDVEVYGACFDANDGAQPLLSMTGGQSNANCTFGLDVSYNRTKYKLAMGQQYGGTGRAFVTCTSPTGVACASWTIVPAADAANAGAANLYSYGRNGSLVPAGTYQASYSVRLSKN